MTVEQSSSLIKNPKLRAERSEPISQSLQNFLKEWDENYSKKVNSLALFNTTENINWTIEQKQYATKILYHARGRLYEFLWHLGNIAPDKQSKDLVLYNFSEEFGGNAPSHEELYFYFAKDMGLSPEEVTDKNYYLDFFKIYNEDQINWLKDRDWNHCISAFSAYERLDNIDYANLHILAKNLGASNRGLIFFRTHSEVEHFSATLDVLQQVWNSNPEIVRDGFVFISDLQSGMWKNVSDTLF